MIKENSGLDIALKSAIKQTNNVANWFDGLSVDIGFLEKIIGAYVLITKEHQHSIINLIQDDRRISASALVRPQYDAMIRGTWLAFKGDEVIANKIAEDTYKFKGLEKMCLQIDTFLRDDFFLSVNQNNINALHSYTHGGWHMLSRCMDENYITPTFSDEEMIEIVNGTTMNMLMMVLAYAVKIDDKSLMEKARAEIVKK